jgi:hypothetical protein
MRTPDDEVVVDGDVELVDKDGELVIEITVNEE